jgi:hypothetical protein
MHVGETSYDFTKAFDCVNELLLSKLNFYEFEIRLLSGLNHTSMIETNKIHQIQIIASTPTEVL